MDTNKITQKQKSHLRILINKMYREKPEGLNDYNNPTMKGIATFLGLNYTYVQRALQ